MFKSIRALITALGVTASLTLFAATLTHKVQPGDTAYSIANHYNITLETLYKYNPQTREGLRAGDVLVLPDNGTVNQQTEAPVTDKTYHTIEKGESLFGIAKRYGMTVDYLLALNPQVDTDGYTAGTVLRLRKDTAVPATPQAPVIEESAQETPLVKEVKAIKNASKKKGLKEPELPEPAPTEDSETIIDETVSIVEEPTMQPKMVITDNTVVLMLPFMSNTADPKDKLAQHSTDFLRGFMIAADTLSHRGANVNIVVCDTYNNLDTVRSILNRPEVQQAAVIIAPSDTMQLQTIAANSGENTWVFNVFAVKDTTFLNNPRVIQGNIPHDEMYGKAIDAFMARYNGYTPVFLTNNNETKNDKAEFTEMLRSQLQAEGRQWNDINYNIALTEVYLNDLDPQGQYVFIPATSLKSEFNHFASTITKFREEHPEASIRFFGYPEYVTFKGTYREALGDLNTTIYSRFFCDDMDYGVRKLNNQFVTKYGREMLEVYPSQAILGYDLGRYLIKALRNDMTDGTIGKPAIGIQTPINLDYDSTTGPVNTAMYIITFSPGGFAEKSVM